MLEIALKDFYEKKKKEAQTDVILKIVIIIQLLNRNNVIARSMLKMNEHMYAQDVFGTSMSLEQY